MVDGVLEGQRLQAALLAERRVERPPHLWRALRLTVSGHHFGVMRCRLRGERVGVRVGERGRGVPDGGLGTHPAEAGRGLVVWRRPRGGVRALSVLQVDQRDAAPVRQRAVTLLVVREAAVGGGMLLSQQGALTTNITLHQVADWRLQAADLAVAAGSDTYATVTASDVI